MRLARLQINGFKSFPDRAELGFDRGVTAIVGPNGCGKSNVVDAITWVLGEQSAKSLRGERMEDVIFNGSDARKPTATAEVRLGLAEVTQAAMAGTGEPDRLLDEGPLVTRDVEIGRRLYRSGESEYLIDGEVCRLRDIHDLLMDSGLGVKAYAVIEQGKIGQILSSRPAERRMLIEEAAGVTKYKSRRRAAELKLEAARQNLTRIDDIVFEVEKQRAALKRQAARARRYRRLREELRRWEQVQFAQRHQALAREMKGAESRLHEARTREAAAAADVAAREAELERVRLELTEAEARATGRREQAHAGEIEFGRRQQQAEFERQQVDELGRRLEALRAETEELTGRREPARVAIETQRDALARARRELQAAKALVESREREYGEAVAAVQAAEQQADQVRAAVLASTTTLSALRQARDNAGEVRDRVAAERGRLDVEARDLQQEADRSSQGRDAAAAALTEAQAALTRTAGRRREIEALLAEQRGKRDELADALTAAQRELAGQEARLHSLEELDRRRATFGDAARLLLSDASSAIRQHGALADHLEVERSYERAVDALLGDLLQHVLVDSHDVVEEALRHLASANAGRCGFIVVGSDLELPYGGMPPYGNSRSDPSPDARRLREVVRARGPHAQGLDRIVPDGLIVDSFERGREVSRSATVPVATREGHVFRGGAIVEGGARQDARGILEMRGDIERRREELRELALSTHRMANELFGVELVIGNAETELGEQIDAQHVHEKSIVGLEAQAARHEEDLARIVRRLQVVETERRRAAEEERAAEERRQEAMAAIADHEQQQRGAEDRLAGVMSVLQAARDAAESRLRRVTDARTDQAALGERVSGLETEVRRLEEAARDLDERIHARTEEIGRVDVRRAELLASIAGIERQLDQDVIRLEALKQEVRSADETVVSRREAFGAREQEIRRARQALESIRGEVTQLEVARATVASDLAHLSSACLEAVNLSIDDVVTEVARMERDGELAAPGSRLATIAVPDEDEGDESAGGEPGTPEPGTPEPRVLGTDDILADLRRKIDRLGPVNMMAIEQFDELETRHAFLTSQRQDLLDSIAQTGDAIRRIEKTTRERFDEAFTSINANFAQTFATLFGGGRAGLVLIDQENDAESGIDIIAQPPGKRLQNVQLLSGGEKALTAMALMFAIFKYRPSPFCLLDEIDAPLDDANIGRFVEMLQGMQTHTQFILITHNRKTMEIANRLYGVTMEEPGVSKLISLQLN